MPISSFGVMTAEREPIMPSGNVIPAQTTFDNTILLADRLIDMYRQERQSLPTLVFLGRGGVEMAGVLRSHMETNAASILHAGVRRIEIPDDSDDLSQFDMGQFPTSDEIKDRHVLAFDAVWRTGAKLKFVVPKLRKLGAASVKTAVIYNTIPPPDEDGYRPEGPDYYQVEAYNLGHIYLHWEWQEIKDRRWNAKKTEEAEQKRLHLLLESRPNRTTYRDIL